MLTFLSFELDTSFLPVERNLRRVNAGGLRGGYLGYLALPGEDCQNKKGKLDNTKICNIQSFTKVIRKNYVITLKSPLSKRAFSNLYFYYTHQSQLQLKEPSL